MYSYPKGWGGSRGWVDTPAERGAHQHAPRWRKLALTFWWVEMRALQRAITKTPFIFGPKVAQNMGVIIDEPVFTMKLTSPGLRTAQTLF